MEPSPPAPARTWILARSCSMPAPHPDTGRRTRPGRAGLLGRRLDHRDHPAAAAGAKLDGSRAGGEDRVVAADAGAVAGPEAGAPLTHDDLAAGDGLAGEHLDAQPLGVRVAAVAAGAQSLLVRHR